MTTVIRPRAPPSTHHGPDPGCLSSFTLHYDPLKKVLLRLAFYSRGRRGRSEDPWGQEPEPQTGLTATRRLPRGARPEFQKGPAGPQAPAAERAVTGPAPPQGAGPTRDPSPGQAKGRTPGALVTFTTSPPSTFISRRRFCCSRLVLERHLSRPRRSTADGERQSVSARGEREAAGGDFPNRSTLLGNRRRLNIPLLSSEHA